MLEIPLDKEITANCLVKTHTKLEELIPVAMVKYDLNRVQPRILDILMLQDKTLFFTFEDNFKQNGVFWRQHLPAVRI